MNLIHISNRTMWSGRSKIEVTNQKVEDLKPLIHKMELLEKLSELNTSVSRMKGP